MFLQQMQLSSTSLYVICAGISAPEQPELMSTDCFEVYAEVYHLPVF